MSENNMQFDDRIEALKNGSELVSNRTKAKVVKNKVAPPCREAEFDVIYGEGISMPGELVDLGVSFGFLKKSGSWYSVGEIRIGQGRDAAKQYLRDNPDFAEKLERDVRGRLAGNRQAATDASAATVDFGDVPSEELAG